LKCMKRMIFTIAVLFSLANLSAQTWNVDKAHAKLGFSVTHLLISDVEGFFKKFDIKATTSKDDFMDATVELTADVNSIDTDNENRDKHLKSPDFFDAEKYPTITFKSTSLKKVDAKKYKLIGNLNMHGVTKQIELDVTFNGTMTHPYSKKLVAGFKISGTIKRSDFGIGSSTPNTVVSDDVTIIANAEMVKD
jgi:polyisoprenoid-binding protein YceI